MPAVIDRIVQECIRNVIEPILEAQFFDHSYGFRPLRNGHHAFEHTCKIIHNTGYHWAIEGDIVKFFDNVNHNILLGALYHMGICDRRILQMIKVMLKAGVMSDIYQNDIGTPQGGIISPLLANVYLNKFDYFITREWEEKKLKNVSSYIKSGKNKGQKNYNIRRTLKMKAPEMKPAYLIRYADDWLVITNSLENAKKLKRRISIYLKEKLKLKLSDKKTKITNVKKRSIKFLGFEIRAREGKSRTGIIMQGKPDRDKLRSKVQELKKNIREFKKIRNINKLIHKINLFNSRVRGIVNYYKGVSHVNKVVAKYGSQLNRLAYRTLRKIKDLEVRAIPANKVKNLIRIHKSYSRTIAGVKYKDMWVGVTDLRFVKWEKIIHKNSRETLYSSEGRKMYRKRRGRERRGLSRKDITLSEKYSEVIFHKSKEKSTVYNFEFFMNRGYVYNVDKGKCRLCGKIFEEYDEVETHHVRAALPISDMNRVKNLATVHSRCHRVIHSSKDFSKELNPDVWKKVLSFRDKLKELQL